MYGAVTSVPVWVQFHNIPMFAWSPLGINWLANRLGRLLCLDEMTERKERLEYAKFLIDVKPDTIFVDDFMVQLVEGGLIKL